MLLANITLDTGEGCHQVRNLDKEMTALEILIKFGPSRLMCERN